MVQRMGLFGDKAPPVGGGVETPRNQVLDGDARAGRQRRQFARAFYDAQFALALLDAWSLFGVALGGPILGLAGAWLAVGRHLAQIRPG